MKLRTLLAQRWNRLVNKATIAFPGMMKPYVFSKIARIHKEGIVPANAEPELLFIHQLAPANSVAMDVGANVGEYLYMLEKSGKFRRIIGFEPIQGLNIRLRRLFPSLSIEQIAVSDHNGAMTFRIPFINGKKYETRGTLSQVKDTREERQEEFSVQVESMDHYVARCLKSETIGLIKVDIEGHEVAFIHGARETITTRKPVLMIEIEQRHHPDMQVEEILQLVLQFGYTCVVFNPATKSFLPSADFSASLHQDMSKIGTHRYLNNFIFLPSDGKWDDILEEIGASWRAQ